MVEVYDLETLKSLFTYSGINVKTGRVSQFIIHKSRNDLEALILHVKSLKGMIGFNSLNFDYPIIHFIIKNEKRWILNKLTNEQIILQIYQKAQDLIEEQNKPEFNKIIAIPQREWINNQLDLFKLWHYNNKARSTSLKALEISMNMDNVMEMPIPHDAENLTEQDITNVLDYNLYDVKATLKFYLKSFDKIELRKVIKAKYNLPCMNWNNGKIGEELILKLYCDKTNQSTWDIKRQRTYREEIKLIDCIPDNIKFTTPQFNQLLESFKKSVVTETKGSISYSVIYKGLKYDYGTGGIHAAIRSGVYVSDARYIIKSLDVASLYPNLAIVYKFFIEHLGPEFLEVYRDDIVGVRLAEKAKPKDKQDKAIVDGYKEAANIPYGKSNDINSFLYDPLYTMKTTIAGQLVISMLCERLAQIPDSQMLMVNTDGCEIRIPREYEQQYKDICSQWEKETKLILEFVDYSKMWIGDINNYGCIDFNGKIKNKGRFEVDKVIGNEPAYHKDNSFRIIPLALQEFFTKGIAVEDTIRNHFKNSYEKITNYGILDFCGRQKFTRDSYGQISSIRYDELGNPFNNIEKQQKNVRYYISPSGETFVKRYNKGTSEVINKGFKVKVFNKVEEKTEKQYDINYQFYIKACHREINQIIPKQTSLF